MHTVDVVHLGAGLLLALVVLRTTQALTEHYFPGSEPVHVFRYLLGGT